MNLKENYTKIKINFKKSKGITLISLVITIVVLIILAGITISTLIGDNGILTSTQSARTKNEKAALEEQIRLAILASRLNDNNDAPIDLDILDRELKASCKLTENEIEKNRDESNKEILPWKIMKNELIFQITEDGDVIEVNGITLSSTEIKLLPGESKIITASLTKGVTGTIKWTSNNKKIVVSGNDTSATVTANGENVETATIIAEIPGTDYSAKCNVMIVSKVTAISSENFQIETNKEKVIEIKTTPSEGVETLTYEYKTNNSNVEVENNGKVKGITPGKTVVTIKGTGNSGTNVSTTCTITVIKAIEPKIGDFVNYSAGTWKQEDLDKLGEYYAGADLPTKSEKYKFGGFALGQSKDESITPYGTGVNKYSSGWRILSKNDDGTFNLIHAGTSEGYYHPGEEYSCYKSQYILGGGINPSGESKLSYETISVRDWSMYENPTYAKEGSARLVTYDEIKSNGNLKNTGSRYWLPLASGYSNIFLFEVHEPGGISNCGYECGGIRPVVTLKSNVKLTAKTGDSQHYTEETAWQIETY